MQKLTHRSKDSRAAVIVSLSTKLPLLFDERAAAISKMSGYPVALHALGRLQRLFDLTSYETLLKSLDKLYNLAYVTAEVIESMDSTNMNKFQINRTDVVAYVDNITKSLKNYQPSDDEVDLIAHLITTSEGNPDAWVLQGAGEEDNLHLQFLSLYRSVLLADKPGVLPSYSTTTNSVVPYNNLPMFSRLYETTSSKKLKSGVNEDEQKEQTARLNNAATIHQYAACRVIDHVYQLLLDRTIWYQFLAPRKDASATSNLERARSLKVFSLYLQSLLNYYQFFSLEMALGAYELVQDWIAAFPALETEYINKIENTIRKHDFLGAKQDVEGILSSFSDNAKKDLGAIVFPREYLQTFGFVKKVDEVTELVDGLVVPASIDSIATFADPKYLPLISSGASSTFDIAYQLADVLIREKRVEALVSEALAGLLPALTRGTAKTAITGLANLQIKCSVPFKVPHAVTREVTAGVVKGLKDGMLSLDSGAPMFSYDYHASLREDFKISMFTDKTVQDKYALFDLGFIVDHDKAATLRSITEYPWRTFQPSFMAPGDIAIDARIFTSSKDYVRQFIETLTGTSYDILIRQLHAPHMRIIFSTYLSGFGLLYHMADDTRELKESFDNYNPSAVNGKLLLVPGYGTPYGTSYPALATLQGTLTEEEKLIPIGWGYYIRLLKKVPKPTDTLRFDTTSFMNQHPYAYFTSNNAALDVKSWVIADGLWNFALIPTSSKSSIPSVRFTPRFSYTTLNLFLNLELYYKPSVPAEAREKVQLNLVEEAWPLNRYQFWTKYIHWGPYCAPVNPEVAKEESVMLADVIKDIEGKIKADTKEGAASDQKTGTALKEVFKETKVEVDKAAHERQGKDMGADDADITI